MKFVLEHHLDNIIIKLVSKKLKKYVNRRCKYMIYKSFPLNPTISKLIKRRKNKGTTMKNETTKNTTKDSNSKPLKNKNLKLYIYKIRKKRIRRWIIFKLTRGII